eukprot:CAMPEP_0172488644 /NCGR_PEP_ID=MMETSP1066-20121228/18275_1 /TAXON_ID=671091 /ORGANISM="Coscinodiscus wailesii, Strain CCMP2513" /LENGTH=804 /DNA_ID=CAMNT_0013256001 /DNA_START=34 /DNA_END=2448 /DNA_ORIENTATION=+
MPIFKRIALVALVALSKTSHGTQLRRGQKYRHLETDNTVTGFATPLDVSDSKSSKEERMSSLTELRSQFDRVTNFINDPSSDLNEDRLKAIVSKMGEFEGAFTQFVNDMTKDEADGEEWEKFNDARRAYREVIGAIVKRGAEFVDDSVSTSNDVSTAVDEDRMNTLEQLDTSFVFMENTIGDAPMNPEGKKLLESFAGTLSAITASFEKMRDDMEENKASKQEWDEFGTVVKDFGSLTVALDSKLAAMTEQVEASVAYSDAEEGGGEDVPGAGMKDGSEEKLAVLTATNRAFDDLEQFLNGMEMNESNTERLQKVVSTMGQIPSQFAAMYDNFEETGADEEQMEMFKTTLERFSAISDKVTERLEESAAYAETEDVPSTTENEQNDTQEGMNDEELVEILRSTNGKIEGANSKEDLLETVKAMEFVHKRVDEMESGKIKSGFEDVMTAVVSKFTEKMHSFEEGSDTSVDESQENVSPPEEMDDVESKIASFTAMLSDIEMVLTHGGIPPAYAQDQLNHIYNELQVMEPSEVVTNMVELVSLTNSTLQQKVALVQEEEEEAEGFDVEEEVGNSAVESELGAFTAMLSDIEEVLLHGGIPPSYAHDQLNYIHNQLKEMEPSEVVTKMDETVALMGKAIEQKVALEQEEEEEVESFDVEEEVGNSASNLEVLTSMLGDIKDSLIDGLNLGSLPKELVYVKSQLHEMEPSEAVTKMDEVVTLMDSALEQKLFALEQEEEQEVESFEEVSDEVSAKDVTGAEDVASAMSKLGFPEAKIEEVKSILNDELEAYDVNTEEKDEIKEDESEY